MSETLAKVHSPIQTEVTLSNRQKDIVNYLQCHFPLTERPFDELARTLPYSANDIQSDIQFLLDQGVLSRFGPLFNIEKLGGCFSLCALKVPEERFEQVTEMVNRYDEVAHNYQRDHEWNMWFVLATVDKESLERLFNQIIDETRCPAMNLPKEKEFFVGLYFEV